MIDNGRAVITGGAVPLRVEGDVGMAARVDEIAEDIFRICTHRPDGLAEGLVYNQFLVRAEQPLLMHTGMRTIFPDVAEAVRRLIKLKDLRWISGAHASRPDEFGAVNDFLAAAPNAQVVAGKVAVNVCLRHIVDRPARALPDGEVLDLGGRTVRFVATAHVPFWEAGGCWTSASGCCSAAICSPWRATSRRSRTPT